MESTANQSSVSGESLKVTVEAELDTGSSGLIKTLRPRLNGHTAAHHYRKRSMIPYWAADGSQVVLPVPMIYTSCGRLTRPDLTFFLCRKRDDMTTLLASKGHQLWMRPNVGLSAVRFHDPLAQFAAGWCKACFRRSSHYLIARFLFPATMASIGFEPTLSSPTASRLSATIISALLGQRFRRWD